MVSPRLPGTTNTLRRARWDTSIDVFKIRFLIKIHIYLFDHDAARRDTLSFWRLSSISQHSRKYTFLCFYEHLSIQTPASKIQENKLRVTNHQFLNHELLLPTLLKINPALLGMPAYYFK